jgi:hypothetical protein
MVLDDQTPGPNRRGHTRLRTGRRKHAQCDATGKRRFRDRHDAGLELRRLSRRRARLDVEGASHSIHVVRSYECGACGGWHLTSWPEPPTPARPWPGDRWDPGQGRATTLTMRVAT